LFPRLFPTAHSRGGEQTHFIENVMAGDKIHMIRRFYDRWKVLSEKTSRRPYSIDLCQYTDRQRPRFHRIASIDAPLAVQRIRMLYSEQTGDVRVFVDGKEIPIEQIAQNDGLTVDDFKEWFFSGHRAGNSDYDGCIIHFTDFRY
jgi:hypothetical protein